MIKKLIIAACLLLSVVSFAQQGTASPYSYYGIGDVRYKGTAEIRSMAGIAVEQDSIHLNSDNPASYSNLKLTTFALGGSYNTTQMKSASVTENARRTTLDYMAVGLPMGKLGVGFGLIPYSSVGYQIQSLSAADGGVNSRYDGSGGVNKAFLGASYKISPKFSFGADVHYNFGKIQTSGLVFVTDVPVGTRELSTSNLSGVDFSVGAMYQTKIDKKLSLFSSISYKLESNLTSNNTRSITAVNYNANFNFTTVDSEDQLNDTRILTLPSRLSVGVGVGEARKWLIGAQAVFGSVGNLVNSYNESNFVSYEKSMRYSLGGYFVPNYNSFSSYTKRIVYRAGLKYDKTGLIVKSESINDMGFTLGLGLPITGSFSNINFGFEMGKRGTTSSGLIQENYANLSIGLSLNDRWFEKRKFQ
jgi:long-subunit fatty acid transport protein